MRNISVAKMSSWPVVSAPFRQNNNDDHFNQNLWFSKMKMKSDKRRHILATPTPNKSILYHLFFFFFFASFVKRFCHDCDDVMSPPRQIIGIHFYLFGFILHFLLRLQILHIQKLWVKNRFRCETFITSFYSSLIHIKFFLLMRSHFFSILFFFSLYFLSFRTARFYWVTNGK